MHTVTDVDLATADGNASLVAQVLERFGVLAHRRALEGAQGIERDQPRADRRGEGLAGEGTERLVLPCLDVAGRPVVEQDEARHVAFGRLSLRDYYPQLTQAERDEREEFAVEACYAMRDRFQAEEVWERLGLPVDECARYMSESSFMRDYRTDLFTRIVPMMKDIGLWGPKIRKAYEQMGIIGYCDTNVEQLSANDQQVAERFERELRERMQDIESVAGAAG